MTGTAVETLRTDTMNQLIGRAPDIQSLLRWTDSRSHQVGALPVTRGDVNEQYAANGVDTSVLGGHPWALLGYRGRPTQRKAHQQRFRQHPQAAPAKTMKQRPRQCTP